MCRHYTAVVCMLEYAYFRADRKDHALHAGNFIAGKYRSYFYTLFYYTTFFIILLFYYVTLLLRYSLYLSFQQ